MLLSDEALQKEFAGTVEKTTETEETTTTEAATETETEEVEDAVLETTPTEKEVEIEKTVEGDKPVVETPKDISFEEDKPINISKQTDGEFEKIEDLVTKYKELKENVITGDNLIEYLNKQSEQEFGMSFNEIVEWKNTDYSKMDEFELLAEHELFKDSDVSEVEIDAELAEFELLKKSDSEIKEMIEDEKLTEKEYALVQAKFNKKVRTARAELTEYRDSLDLGKIKVPTTAKADAPNQPTEEEINAAKEQTKTDVESLGKLKFNVGGKENPKALEIMITKEQKESMVNSLNGGSWVLDRWKNEDGTIDRQKVYRDNYVLKNIENIVKTAYNEGIVNGRKEQVINEDNITLKDGRTIPNGGGENDITKMTEAMFG